MRGGSERVPFEGYVWSCAIRHSVKLGTLRSGFSVRTSHRPFVFHSCYPYAGSNSLVSSLCVWFHMHELKRKHSNKSSKYFLSTFVSFTRRSVLVVSLSREFALSIIGWYQPVAMTMTWMVNLRMIATHLLRNGKFPNTHCLHRNDFVSRSL